MTYFISAPFGNFLQHSTFAQNATCVTGTFTLKPRPGRFKQIIKTLRYVRTEAGWTWRNQLGLRNPGIFVGIENTAWHSVMSIASLEPNDWKILYQIVPKTMSVEEGAPFGVECDAPDGWPKPSVYWMLQGQNWLKTINSSR